MKKAVSETSLETKALYNSLRMMGRRMKLSPQDSWKVADWRGRESTALFNELKEMGVVLDPPLFYQWAAHCETPEDLFDFLFMEEGEESAEWEEERKDHLYLLLFELWRRLVPEKRSLSLVADEIDHVLFAFDSGKEMVDEEMENALEEWVRLLNRLHDEEGLSAKEALHAIEPHFAHSVPDCIIDFLLDVSERGESERYGPLFEKVRPFLTLEPLWAKIVELRFCLREDMTLVNKKLGDLVAHVLTTPDVECEVIFALCDISLKLERGELFLRLLERVAPCLQEQEDVEVVVHLLADFLEERPLPALKASLESLKKDMKTQKLSLLKEKLAALIAAMKKAASFT